MPAANRPARGGRRPGAGRPPGSQNHITQEVGDGAEALQVLVSIMRNRKSAHLAIILIDPGPGQKIQHHFGSIVEYLASVAGREGGRNDEHTDPQITGKLLQARESRIVGRVIVLGVEVTKARKRINDY